MDNKQQMGSEDLPSPGIQAFKDWASKPAKDTPVGRMDTQAPEEPITTANISEVGSGQSFILYSRSQMADGYQGETVIIIGASPEMNPSVLSKAVGQTGQIISVIPRKVTHVLSLTDLPSLR